MAIDPKQLRRVMGDIRATVQEQPRDALVEILSYLYKEYVIEGSGPIGSGAGQVLDAKSHLEGLSFAELVTWLQQHVNAPELALFEVQGSQVSVRGQAIALEAPRANAPVEPVRAVAPAPVAPPPPAAATARANPTTPAAAPTPSPAAAPAPASTPQTDSADRFSWLEVD
jgi:cell division septation protein DedD